MQTLKEVQERVNATIGSGVWPRSTEVARGEYIIFASDLDFDATVAHLNEHEVTFKNLRGSYVMDDGQKVEEDSFIVNVNNIAKIMPIIQQQESILALGTMDVHQKRQAALQYLHTGKTVGLGEFKPVSAEYAQEQDNWTYDPYMKQYFVAEQNEA